ncbi:MAG: hypothetical protein ACYCYF_05235 [Anaerolineae bacterium]
MTERPAQDWERIWQELTEYAPHMSEQGREYLDLATRLVRANQILMELPALEDEAFQEVQGISMLLHSVGEPEERYVYELIDLITHLLDRLYVRLEYVKWEVSPLSQLPPALAEMSQDPDLSNEDRSVLAFLTAYDAAVRTGRGLADPNIRQTLSKRLSQIPADSQHAAQRRLRAMLDQIIKLLGYYNEQSGSS